MEMFSATALLLATATADIPAGPSVILPSLSTVLLKTRGAERKREHSGPEQFSTKMIEIPEIF